MAYLSIILPVYNTKIYLQECVDSLYKNGVDENIEVIFIDDGSTDGSAELLDSISFSNAKIFHRSNHGVSDTRNYGIKQATGRWVMFVDSDDFLLPNWINTVKKYELSNSDIIFFTKEGIEATKKDMIMWCLNYQANNYSYAAPFSKMYKRDFLLRNNIIFQKNIINGEDMLFNTEALIRASNIQVVNSPIYSYRVSNASSTKRYNSNFFDSNFLFRIEIKKILQESDLFTDTELFNILMVLEQRGNLEIIRRITYLKSLKNYKRECKKMIQKMQIKVCKKNDLKTRIMLIMVCFHFWTPVYYIFKLWNKKLDKLGSYFLEI